MRLIVCEIFITCFYCLCMYVLFCLSRSSLSTYKELCSIASDLNQPDLIYKFMHLASHNAMWNSRKVEFNADAVIITNTLF